MNKQRITKILSWYLIISMLFQMLPIPMMVAYAEDKNQMASDETNASPTDFTVNFIDQDGEDAGRIRSDGPAYTVTNQYPDENGEMQTLPDGSVWESDGKVVEFNTPIKKNMTLRAAQPYYLTYYIDNNGNDNTPVCFLTYPNNMWRDENPHYPGETVTLPVFRQEGDSCSLNSFVVPRGYEFQGWQTEVSSVGTPTITMPYKDLDVHGKFEQNKVYWDFYSADQSSICAVSPQGGGGPVYVFSGPVTSSYMEPYVHHTKDNRIVGVVWTVTFDDGTTVELEHRNRIEFTNDRYYFQTPQKSDDPNSPDLWRNRTYIAHCFYADVVETETCYNVLHLFRNSDGKYVQKAEYPRQTYKDQEIGTKTNAQAYKVDGYVAQPFDQMVIDPYCTTTVRIMYDPVEDPRTSATVKKEWNDNNNAAEKRPESLDVTLKLGNTDVKTVTLNEKNHWQETVRNLEIKKDDNGNRIPYTWTEPTVEGYSSSSSVSEDGTVTTFTNTYGSGTTEVMVTKIWDDDSNSKGKRPESVIFQLMGGNESRTGTCTGTGDEWTFTFTELPLLDENGDEIIYTVTEVPVPGYESEPSSDGRTFTNRLKPVKKLTSDFAQKSVLGQLRYGEQPFEFKIIDIDAWPNEVVATGSVTFNNESRIKSVDFQPSELIYEDAHVGDVHNYEVWETTTDSEARRGWDLDNKWAQTVKVIVTEDPDTHELKAQLDGNGALFTNTFGFYEVFYKVEGPAVCNPYGYSTSAHYNIYYEPLAQYGAGNNIPVVEPIPECDGYTFYADWPIEYGSFEYENEWWYQEKGQPRCTGTDEYGGNCILGSTEYTENHLKGRFVANPKDISLEFGEKVVRGSGYGEETFTFTITPTEVPEGVTQDPATVNVKFNESGSQTQPINYTFTYEKAGEYRYTIAENPVPTGWSVSPSTHEVIVDVTEDVGGLKATVREGTAATFTNTKLTTVSGEKTWLDGNDEANRPDITIRLMNGDTEIKNTTVTSANSWKYEFTDIPMYDENGTKIEYTVKEDKVQGYDPSYSGYDVTNTKLTTISGEKKWLDDGENRPPSITVILTGSNDAGYTYTDSTAVSAGEGGKWTYEFEDLPMYDENGNEITYTVDEAEVAGYSKRVNGTNLVNTKLTEATVRKVWNDANNQDGKRPTSLTVTLSNGTEVTLNEANSWTATVEKLPMYDEKGVEIEYTWSETNMPEGYTLTGNAASGTVTTLTNTHEPEKTESTVRKVWEDNNNEANRRPASLTVTLSNGTVVILNEANGWSATVTDLPKYANGSEIAYTWTEGTVAGYTFVGAAVNGTVTTLTNRVIPTYDVEIIYVNIETGEEIHERVTIDDLEPGDTFSVTDPEIPGYYSLNDGNVVSDTITNRSLRFVRYYAPVTTPGGPSGGGEPGGEGDPEPPLRLYTLVDIDDLETPLGLAGLNINVGECIE